MHKAGFTLVEVAVVLAVSTLLVTLTVPSALGALTKSRRSDAVNALTRVQLTQEQFRAQHGIYSANPRALIGAPLPRSDGGHYDITLQQVQAERYQAWAVARADSPQARDVECQQITVTVNDGSAEFGPSLRCWNR